MQYKDEKYRNQVWNHKITNTGIKSTVEVLRKGENWREYRTRIQGGRQYKIEVEMQRIISWQNREGWRMNQENTQKIPELCSNSK